MNDKDWPQHDEQGSIGVLFDIKKESWPVSIAFDVFASGDEDKHRSVKYQAHTVETHLGIRKIFKRSGSSIKPYLGGGVAFVWAEEKNNDSGTTRSQDDSSNNGAWVGGGMYVEMAPDFSLGLDIRYSGAEVSLFDADREAGGLSTGISAVYNW